MDRSYEETHRTISVDWLVVAGRTIFLSIASATLLWAFALFVLSLSK